MGVLTRLFDFLPTYFDLAPQQVAAFTLEHDDPKALMRHSVIDGRITARAFDSFSNDFDISLGGKIIQQVADEINLVPHYAATVFTGAAEKNAICLVDTENESTPYVYIHNSPTWALFKAIALELQEARAIGDEVLRQMGIPGAVGIFSNHWGSYFNVSRFRDESDAAYDQRIINSFVRPKSNNVAMEIILQSYYGYYIRVFDLDFYEESTMLMNNINTPVHNPEYPIYAADAIGKEECVFGLMFPEGTVSQWNQTQFDELQEIVYSTRAAGTRPKLFWTDAPVFDPADIPYEAGFYFYTKYL